ncbi:hypothetical protein BVX97_04355 [bacterium E08(2017)]|nr:hypothetical protein BVX97_04355 [bacterium E08(2017)]
MKLRWKILILFIVAMGSLAVFAGPETAYPDLRLKTEGEGMFYVSSLELSVALSVPKLEVENVLAAGNFNLTHGGTNVARLVAAGGAGFYFYGQKVNSGYTLQNAYFIEWVPGVDMAVNPGVGPVAAPGGSYARTIELESDIMPVTACFSDPEDDFYVWAFYYAPATNDYEIFVDGLSAGSTQAILNVGLVGYSDTGTPLEHHANVMINGTVIGDVYWQGKTIQDEAIAFDTALLVPGTNVITLGAVLDTGAPFSQFYLDGFRLTYDSEYKAIADQIQFDGATNPVVTVTGFTASNVYAADLSNPLMPVMLTGVTVDETNAVYDASFAPSNAITPYLLYEIGASLSAESIEQVSSFDLTAATNDIEYVIITTPELQSASQVLADYRQGQRLNSRVILLQDIYDQFNHGIAEPQAIQDFVTYAHSNWTYPLRYVLLAGSGNYDYRGVSGAGDQHVPPMMFSRSEGLTSTDTWYGDVDGDFAMEVAIGRLPAVTAANMTNMVRRIVDHESEAGQPWRQTIIMLADNPDHGGNFHVSSDDVSGVVPGEYSQEQIKMNSGAAAAASNQLINAINNGALFMNFFGHSGLFNLTAESILNNDNAASLVNTNRLPVLTSLSCSVGRYEIPELDCLGESLMLMEEGGAIAVIAPSSRALNRESIRLSKEFYKSVFSDRKWIIGDALVEAMGTYEGKNFNKELLRFYNLMGDPALYLAETGAPTDDPFGQVLEEVVTWKTNYYNTAQLDDPTVSGDFSDSDGDGLTAIAEYALGLDPTFAERSSFVTVKKSEVVLTEDYDAVVEFKRRKGLTGIGINISVTSDWLDWREGSSEIVHTQVLDTGDGVTETVKCFFRMPGGTDRLFVTVTVEKLK